MGTKLLAKAGAGSIAAEDVVDGTMGNCGMKILRMQMLGACG